MKTRIKSFFFACLFCMTAMAAQAQISPEQAARMKDGVFMNNGRLMQIKNGQLTDAPASGLTLGGSKISADGTVTLKNGQKRKLKSGYAVNNEGNVVLLKDDMFKPDAIEEHSKEVLGNTETVIEVSEEGTRIYEGGQPVPATSVARDTTDYKQKQRERRQAEYTSRITDLQMQVESKRSQRRAMTNNKGKVKKRDEAQARQLDREIKDLQEQINSLTERMRSE